MTLQLTPKQILAAKKHAIPALRYLGVRDISAYEPHTQNWSDLSKHSKLVLKDARALMDKISDTTPEAEGAEIEEAFSALMTIYDAVEGEKDKRSERGSRAPRPHGGDPRRPMGPDGETRGDGWEEDSEDVSYFIRPDQRMATWAAAREQSDGQLPSLGNYLRSMVTGPKSDAEKRALSEGTDSAGGYTVPTLLSASLIDRLRAASVVNRAGAITVPLGSDNNVIAKLLSDPVPAWRNENAVVAESDPTFGPVAFVPKSLAVLVKVSRELLEDSLNVGTALPNALTAALALELDRVALLGTGVAPQPRGVANFVNLTANGFAGGDIGPNSYAALVKAKTALRMVNSDVTAFIMSAREEGRLSEMVDTTGQPLQPPKAIADIPHLATTAIPVNGGTGLNEGLLFAGDWRKLMIGIRTDIRIEILRERYAENMQYGFLCHLRADVAAEHEQAFTVLDGITPPAP